MRSAELATVADRAGAALDVRAGAAAALRVTRFRDCRIDERRRDLIHGLVPAEAFALAFGASGSGKTFAIGHAAVCVAAQRDFLGRRVARAGGVVYVSPENPRSVETRFAAWRTELDLDADLQLAIVEGSIDMIDERSAAALREQISDLAAEFGSLALIVIDTVSQAIPGADENSSEGMTAFVAACQALRHEFGCAVLGVHHTGKAIDRGARGHSSLRAAVDVEIEVTDADGYRQLEVTKMRDGAAGLVVPFRLTPIAIGTDADGVPITTCLVEARFDAPARPPVQPKGTNQKLVFEVLQRCASAVGEPPPEQPLSPIRRVSLRTLREELATNELGHVDSQHRASRISAAISSLKANGFVDGDDAWIWVAHRSGTTETEHPLGVSVRSVAPKAPKDHRTVKRWKPEGST